MTKPTFDLLNNGAPLVGMIVFALTWYVAGIYAATAALMALMFAQLVLLRLFSRTLEKTTVALFVLVFALGSLTLLLRDKVFIQLKTTIVYTLFAMILLISDFVLRKNLPRLALEKFFLAPDVIWRRVSVALALFFLALAACNYFVARHLSEAVWVGVKTFGFPAATLVFTIVLLVALFRYARAEEEE